MPAGVGVWGLATQPWLYWIPRAGKNGLERRALTLDTFLGPGEPRWGGQGMLGMRLD